MVRKILICGSRNFNDRKYMKEVIKNELKFLEEELVSMGEGFSKQEAQTDAAGKGLQAKNWS